MRSRLVLLLLMVVTSLAACVAVPGPGGDRRDIVTASDETRSEKTARIRVELAAAYFAQGQYITALDEVKRALVADPGHVGAHNLRGSIYAALGENAFAEESFQRALQLAPQQGDIHHNYGWFLCGMRRYAEAGEQFSAALAAPGYRDAAKTWQARGYCEAKAGDLGSAEQSLRRSFELDPNNPGTAFNLAELALRRGDVDRAGFYIGRVNAVAEQTTADSLWLALRIERRRGNQAGVDALGRQLRARFPQSRPVQLLDQGLFDE